jgi:alkaline phosphatase D
MISTTTLKKQSQRTGERGRPARYQPKLSSQVLYGLCALFSLTLAGSLSAEVYQANGIKIGEVDQNSALIWTRLTLNEQANNDGAGFIRPKKSGLPNTAEQLPKGKTLAGMQGAVPGAAGSVRISWASSGEQKGSTAWMDVDTEKDFTLRHQIRELAPGTGYTITVESRDPNGTSGQTIDGKFRTAPALDQEAPVSFVVVSCQEYARRDSPQGHKIYPVMQALDPDFFVHTGDIEYYDKPDPFATNVELARFKWNRLYGLSNLSHFHNNVASYFIKDDHDTTCNDAWPGVNYGELTWQQGLDLFREQFPVKNDNYRTIRWGKDLQIWLVEGRDYRSPNTMPDGPEKTIWGKKQKQWFFRTFKESDATFRLLISPTAVVGPDRSSKNDNHANKGFTHEGNEIRNFIASQKNAYIVCGDRHWQYVSVDGKTGVKEYSCGATSDKHAGGWKKGRLQPEHQYLKVKGGFLGVSVSRKNGIPTLKATHYGVNGEVYNEDINQATE